MKCLSCKHNFLSKKYNKIMYLKFSNGNCIESCPDNLFLTKNGLCVETCPYETYKYFPNTSCVDSCPKNYIVDSDKIKCISNIFEQSISTTEFKEIISNNISSYVDSSTIINCTDFKAQIISSEDIDPKEQIKMGISGIDLGNCIEVLKSEYKIPKGENLIIVEIETKENKEKNKNLDIDQESIDLGKNVELAVYDYNGNKLNMGLCEEEIVVMKYIGDLKDIDINKALELAKQGIDIFNAKDSFFNDFCYPYSNNSDITLSDRREDLYQNISFCGEECLYDGIDYELLTAKCLCEAELIQFENEEDNNGKDNKDKAKGITLNDIANSFTSSLLDFNYIVIKCYNLVFDTDILRKNIGFFTFISMNILEVFFLVFFSIQCLKPIKNYMLVFEPFDPKIDPPNPPKKIKKLENTKIREILDNINIDSNNKLSKKEKEIQKTIFINNLLENKKAKKDLKNNNKKESVDDDDTIIVRYVNSEESSKNTNKNVNEIDKNIKNNYINNSDSGSENIKSSEINLSLNNKKSNLTNKNKKNLIRDKNVPFYGTYDVSSNKSEFKVEESKKRNTIFFSNIFSPKSNKLKIKNLNLDKIKGTKKESKFKDAIKSDRENLIIEQSEEGKNKDKFNNENIFYIHKKKKKDINNNTLKNALKESTSGRNIMSTDLFTQNIYNNNKFYKNYKNIQKRNQKTKDEITKNTQIKSTLNKNSIKNITKEKVATDKKLETTLTNNNNIGNMILRNKNVNYAYTDEELNEMNFEDAFQNDKRSFLRMYWAYLLDNHIIINTFFAVSYLDLRIIKISFLIYTFEISFFLNAFFYSDEYISETYHNNGALDFFSSLPKSIYSVIVTMIGGNLLKMLSSSKNQLNKIIKERQNKADYLKMMNLELSKLRNKLIIYFICVYILGIFFLYYVSAFCAVYQKSQLFWFYGCLESLGLDFITPFLICLIFASLRFLALVKHLRFFYVLANILNIIL